MDKYKKKKKGARDLATKDHRKAVSNAYCHEYFARDADRP